MIADTDMRMLPFVLSRVYHTCLAGIYTYIACRWAGNLDQMAAPAMAVTRYFRNDSLISLNFKIFLLFLILLAAIIITALLFHMIRSLKLLR